jgi:hypothetical protein
MRVPAMISARETRHPRVASRSAGAGPAMIEPSAVPDQESRPDPADIVTSHLRRLLGAAKADSALARPQIGKLIATNATPDSSCGAAADLAYEVIVNGAKALYGAYDGEPKILMATTGDSLPETRRLFRTTRRAALHRLRCQATRSRMKDCLMVPASPLNRSR